MSCCPLSPYEAAHNYRQERNPSFGISVHDDNTSIFHCFTCHREGPLTFLLTLLGERTGEDYEEEIAELDTSELLGPPIGQWKERGDRRAATNKPEPLGIEYYDLFEPVDPEHPYLIERGVTRETCRRLQIGYDPADSDGIPRIVFPVFNPDRELMGYTGRATIPDAQPKIRDYYGLPKQHCLLGIHKAKYRPFVCLTEGLFDYAIGQQYGLCAVGSMFSGLTVHQARMLIKLGKPVYGFGDNDAAGQQGMAEAARALSPHLPFMAVRWPEGVGDVGDLTKAQMWQMVANASLYRI